MNVCLQQTHLISSQTQIHIKTKYKENRSLFIELLLGTLHDFHYVYCLILHISEHAGSALNLSEKDLEDFLLKGSCGLFPKFWKEFLLPLNYLEVKKT